MDEKLPGRGRAGEISAPQNAEKTAFLPTAGEKIAAFALYLLAYLYVRYIMGYNAWAPQKLCLFVFCEGFAVLAELLQRGTERSRESWIWAGCAAICLASLLLERCRAWNYRVTLLFLHAFSVWWLLSRSGRLCEGRSGHLLPFDALNGFVRIPFRHFFLRVRTTIYTLTHLRGGKSPGAETIGFSALALAAAAGLFVLAAGLLIRADRGFAELLEGLTKTFRIELDDTFLGDLVFSLPVGAWLFGLLAGTARTDPEELRERGERTCAGLVRLRRVPDAVWGVLVGVFCLFYAVFFAVQFRYLFGAFTRTLPEGFIVSQYAREGFFELCKVMAVNFLLLWLVARSARDPLWETPRLKALALALLAESLLFAVTAASKLLLYIDCFGFTPKRLLSGWLICVLACGCVCTGIRLLHGPKTFRVWMIFSAVTAALLTLY